MTDTQTTLDFGGRPFAGTILDRRHAHRDYPKHRPEPSVDARRPTNNIIFATLH